MTKNMKFIKTYESYLKEFDNYIELDLKKFYEEEYKLGNNVDNHNDRLHRLAKLKSIVVNNIVTFKGKHEDNNYYENVKGLITNIFLGEGFSSFEFVISDYSISMNMNILNYYKVDNTIPIKIHITESIANKFNL